MRAVSWGEVIIYIFSEILNQSNHELTKFWFSDSMIVNALLFLYWLIEQQLT